MLRNRQEDILKFCEDHDVLLRSERTKRHYLLADQTHTDTFFGFAAGFKDAEFRRKIGIEIMEELGRLHLIHQIGVIVVPPMGGMLLGATLQHLFYGEKPVLIYPEKERGKFYFRRGFKLPEEAGIFLLDDVCNSGGTFRALNLLCKSDRASGPIIAMCAIVDRNPNQVFRLEETPAVPLIALVRFPVLSYFPLYCPYDGIYPLEKDGMLVDNSGQPLISEQPVED